LAYTDRWKKAFLSLGENDRIAKDRKLQLFRQNPRHPSLRSKPVQGNKDVWESSVSMNIRFTWEWSREKGTVILRNVGPHDKTLKRP